jgi:hypothetical protein
LKIFPSQWLVTLAAVLLFAEVGLAADSPTSREYQLKAVFLFNFTHFVNWPPTAFPDSHAPFVIGIIGNNPFGSYLDDTVRGEKVDGRPIVIQRYRRPEEIEICQVLFISRSQARELPTILARLNRRGVLTVAEFEGFATRGGMIRFLTDDNKVRFRINLAAAKNVHLTIDSSLLRAAEIAHTGED